MMNRILFLLVISLVFSCKMEEKFFPGNISNAKFRRDISKVVIDTVFPWKNVNFLNVNLSHKYFLNVEFN